MNITLLRIGGVLNLLGAIFHLSFWKLLKWPESLSCLAFDNRAVTQVLNIHLALVFFVFAFISLFHTKEMLSSKLGKSVMISIAFFYAVRLVNEIVFWGLINAESLFILGLCLVFVFLYGLPFVFSKKSF
ncbi:hypothetical protein KKA14_18960 [bacterium]|nr:hypothetical protein [bacterium]